MTTKNVTDENFEIEVLKATKPTLVDFWAEWCGPCKQIGPALEEISDEMKDQVVIAKHNIDQEPNTPTKYGIKGIPTMLLLKVVSSRQPKQEQLQNQILLLGLKKIFNFYLRYFRTNKEIQKHK